MVDEFRANCRSKVVDAETIEGYGPNDVLEVETGEVSGSPVDDIYIAQLQQSMISELAGDDVAIKLVRAAIHITGSGNVDQELAR